MLEFLFRFSYTALVLIYVFTLYFEPNNNRYDYTLFTISLKSDHDNAVII